jgi:hypothetical protein
MKALNHLRLELEYKPVEYAHPAIRPMTATRNNIVLSRVPSTPLNQFNLDLCFQVEPKVHPEGRAEENSAGA